MCAYICIMDVRILYVCSKYVCVSIVCMYVCICMYVHVCTCMYVCMYVCMNVCMCVGMCVGVCGACVCAHLGWVYTSRSFSIIFQYYLIILYHSDFNAYLPSGVLIIRSTRGASQTKGHVHFIWYICLSC